MPPQSTPKSAARPCVPPGASAPRPRASRTKKWRALVLVLVHVAIVLHLVHWWLAGETLSPLEPSEAMEFSKNGIINAGLVFFALSGLATLLFGRFFCGWACHLVAIQDACYWMLTKIGIRPKPMRARLLLIVPTVAFIYMFLYPAIYRWWTGAGFPERTLELSTTGFWDTFPPWPVALATFAIAGFSIIYFLGAKGFCTYACPYGALYGALDRFSPAAIRVNDDCKGCGHCTQVCTSDVQVSREVHEFGMVVDSGCMKCLDCVSVCPENALSYGFAKPSILAKRRSGSKLTKPWSWWKGVRWKSNRWGEELLLALFFLGAFLTFRGLYDSVPFLFSLGIAGIFAYCTLQFVRLFYSKKVALQNIALKSNGSWTRSGFAFAGVMVLALAFQGHSAVVQHHRRAAQASYDELYPKLEAWFTVAEPLTAEEEEKARRGLEHVETLRDLAPLAVFSRERWRVAMLSGWLHLMLGDEARFREEMELAMDVRPGQAAPYDGLANYHAAAGRLEEAGMWFERQTRAAPEGARAWSARATWLADVGREEEALAVLEEGTAEAAEPGSLWRELGKRLADREQRDEALSAFEHALRHDPEDSEARYLYASLLYDLGRREECVEHYEFLLEERPNDVHLRLQTTLALMELDELARAQVHAQAARDAAPELPEPWVALSQIARQRGDEAEAERLYEEATRRVTPAPER